MRRLIGVLVGVLMMCGALAGGIAAGAAPADAARLQIGASSLTAEGRDRGRPRPLTLRLALDRAVPYRVFMVDDPVRLIVDLKGVDLSGLRPADLFGHDRVPAIRWGEFRRDWSRIVIELPAPYRVVQAGLRAAAIQPELTVVIKPVAREEFQPRPSATAALRNLPEPVATDPGADEGDGLTVALDPGHGGFDPGAESGGATEANLVLTFALELRAALRARGIGVVMTREDDSFVSLEARMTAAREAGADLFVSLHADALPTGQAAGATVYTWDPRSDDRAAGQLAARHNRDDLMQGVDLGGEDDVLATVLMDFARTDTQPRSEAFARFLTSRMALMGIGLHDRPVQRAAFSVLKSPDIPSVLLELGFISDPSDLARLRDPAWRARMVGVVAESIGAWAREDHMRKSVLRR